MNKIARRGFTLIELLVVIAIIAILAAILFPVFAQAKEAAKKAADLSNQKQTSTAIQIYLSDSDDLMPLGFGKDLNGNWTPGFYMLTPYDWSTLTITSPDVSGSRSFALNTVQPYMKNYDMLKMPGATDAYSLGYTLAAGKARYNTSYSYNGLLQAYNASGVASPSKLPVIWPGRARFAGIGNGFSTPALNCATPNVACNYLPRANNACQAGNGGSSSMYVDVIPLPTYWMFSQGGNFAFADSSAKWRRLGATLNPNNTDYRVDPFTGYNAQGSPGFYWWDGCHAWLFRPDYDFSQ